MHNIKLWSPNNKKTLTGLHYFLSNMPKSDYPHGKKYHYCSPHSDLLGWIIERIAGDKYYNVLSNLLFLINCSKAFRCIKT